MVPAFDLQGGWLLAGARAAAVGGMVLVFGSLVFRTLVMPRALVGLAEAAAGRISRRLQAMSRWGAAAALAGALGWLVVQAGTIASAGSAAELVAAIPPVLLQTEFGHLILAQIVALLACLGALAGPDRSGLRWSALSLAALALALQAGHSHAASMHAGPSLLLGLDLLHLAGAGAWLGGLPPLLLVVRVAAPRTGAAAARWFSPMGKLCIAALVISAIGQSWVLVGSLVGFVGTGYGWMLLLKLVLFGILLGFAAANRYRFAPALLDDQPERARAVLVRSIAVQSGFGVAIVVAAAVLSNLPPAMHLQSIWPFADRFTLDTVHEDPGFRTEALGGALALGGAMVLLGVAVLLRRRWSWLIAACAVAIAGLAVPHLDLLFVPAYPTSYYHCPTGFAASSILAGADLYPGHCAVCHGAEGRGDGPAANTLPVPAADLTAAHLWMHSDGELFWWLSQGITAPDGRQAMPGFAAALSEDQRWALIDFIRARNAGAALAATGHWPAQVQAPGLQARCAGNAVVSLADLRGGFLRLVDGAAGAVAGVTTIVFGVPSGTQPGPGLCVADDQGLPRAYGIVGGVPASQMQGSQFLVDGAGWLRAVQRASMQPGWTDAAALAREIAQLKANPVHQAEPGGMTMDMKMDMKM